MTINVRATCGKKLHSTIKDGASKDFSFFFDEFTIQEMVLKTLIV